MASPPPPAKVDRQTTTPFLLRLFYKHNGFHHPDDFDPARRLPPNLQIYTWYSCTLRELSSLLLTTLPNLLPQPYAGTRIAFRLVYGDMNGPQRPGTPARFLSRELGSVVVGAQARTDESDDQAKLDVGEALKHLDGEPEKTLGDAKFVIGDYVSCAVLPPLADGSVQPAPPPPPTGPARSGPPPRDSYMRGSGGRDSTNGYGGRGAYDGFGRGGRGRGGRFDDRRDFGGVPAGEWRRGEAPPEREPGYWRGGRDDGRGRGRGRW